MRLNENHKKWLLLTCYLVCVILLALIHEPWIDELHAWVMARDMSAREIWGAMKVEGHFCLWHLILMPFAKAKLNVFCLQIISILFTVIAAWLFVFKTDFSYGAKVAVLLSFPMIYYFPVISRCYALVPPILMGIALTYKRLNNNKYLFAILVGFLAHTHLYMEGMVLALFLVYIYKMIIPKYKENRLRVTDFGPLVLIVLFVLLAFVQVARNPLVPVYIQLGDNIVVPSGNKGLSITVSNIFKGYSILPYDLFEPGLTEILAYTLAFLPMLILSLIIFYNFSIIGRFITIVSIGWQLLLSLVVYFIGHQRIYLPFFIIITIIMMMDNRGKKINTAIICLCILASISGYLRHIRNDVLMTYSSIKPLAEAIEENVPENKHVYSIEFSCDAISAYLNNSNSIIVPMPLDNIKDSSFYVISSPRCFDGFDMDYVYDGSSCFWDKYSLMKLTRLENNQ